MIYIGIDDTDNKTSRGTGHLARLTADDLGTDYEVKGVSRHQLLFDPRIPYTAKNSSAAIHLNLLDVDIDVLFERVKKVMLDNFEVGSDPGLVVSKAVSSDYIKFGNRAKKDILKFGEAYQLVERDNSTRLESLGGTQDGVIGALAAVGLAAGGNDGRYIRVGSVRDLEGLMSIQQVLSAGVDEIRMIDGRVVDDGIIVAEKLRPARRGSKVILFVEAGKEGWKPLKLD